jgi:hypothetical protein
VTGPFVATCVEPPLDQHVTSYCFDDDLGDAMERFEAHLLHCDSCWREVQRLEASVRALRLGAVSTDLLLQPEVVGVFHMSGRVDHRFAGHGPFVIAVALLHGLLYAASLWTELAYSYDRFSTLLWTLTPLVLICVSAGTIGAFLFGASHNARRHETALAWSASIAIATVTIATTASFALLPEVPTLAANFETRSAAVGYLKNVVQYFAPLLIFIVPTFHAVVALQRELHAGRHAAILEFVSGHPEGTPPRGVWVVPLWLLTAGLLVGLVVGQVGASYLLDNVKPGPYRNLFTTALYVRIGLWWVTALLCLVWYQRRLEDLKREARVVVKMFRRAPVKVP